MLKWLQNSLSAAPAQYTTTFESIISPITKVISDLETHADENAKLNHLKSAEAQKLLNDAQAHREEVQKASATALKFKALIAA